MPQRAKKPCSHPGCGQLTTSRWCEEHTKQRDAWGHTKSASKRGYGWKWQKTRERVLKRDKYLCQPCLKNGKPVPADAVDHISPKSLNGTDDDWNLQAICNECHQKKTQEESKK